MQYLGKCLGKFYPDYIIRGISDITPPLDLDDEISAIFFDYDNSVAGFGEEIKEPERKVLERLGETSIKLFVVTNAHASRINTIKDNLAGLIDPENIINPECCADNCVSSIMTEKPSSNMIKYALARHSLKASQVLLVGDRIFNDIIAGNRAGVRTVLVSPLGREHTAVKYLQRPVERLLRVVWGLPVEAEDFPQTLTPTPPQNEVWYNSAEPVR